MVTLFDQLGLGGQALLAQQYGLQVTGANIANANVAGYHREDVVMASAAATGGVQTATMARAVDAQLEAQVSAAGGEVAYADGRAQGLGAITGALGGLGPTGLSAAVNAFFAGWRALSVRPADQGVRQQVLGSTQALVDRVHAAAAQLQGGQRAADAQAQNLIGQANALIVSIAELGQRLDARDASSPAAELQDARDLAVQQLAALTGATQATDTYGNFNVYIAGVAVVSDATPHVLLVQIDATTGFANVGVAGTTQWHLDGRLAGGALGAQLALRDVDFAAPRADLDTFVQNLATAVNAQHALGFGSDNQSGRDLFGSLPGVSGAAASLCIDPSVAGQPAALAAASQPNAPGDNTMAATITGLAQSVQANGGTETYAQTLANLVATSGQSQAAARANQAQARAGQENLKTLWEQSSGVSLQDQLLSLSRYQAAFIATTKMLEAVQDILRALEKL